MAKYYISSGDFQFIIDRNHPKKAILDAFNKLKDMKDDISLSLLTRLSEAGFETCTDDDIIFDTMMLLEETGQAENYQFPSREELNEL